MKLDDRDYKIKLALTGKQSAFANVNISESVVSSTTANIATAKANCTLNK